MTILVLGENMEKETNSIGSNIVASEIYVNKRVVLIKDYNEYLFAGDTGTCTADLEDWEEANGVKVDLFAVWFDKPIAPCVSPNDIHAVIFKEKNIHWITFKEKGIRNSFKIIE